MRMGTRIDRTSTPFLMLGLICLVLSGSAGAQYAIIPGAADFDDCRAGLGNPAILPFTGQTVFAGYHVYQPGFLSGSLYTFALAYHSPYWAPGGGVAVQWFRSDAFQTGEASLRYGLKLAPGIALGLKAGAVFRQFGSGAFRDHDPRDPLLSSLSKAGLSLGGGMVAYPSPRVRLGLFLDHVNQPDLSVGDKTDPLPLEVHGQVQFMVGALQPGFRFEYRDERLLLGGYILTAPFYGFSLYSGTQGGPETEGMSVAFGVRFDLAAGAAPSAFRLQYEQELAHGPLSEYGGSDHEVGLALSLDRLVPIPDLPPVGEFEVQRFGIDLPPARRYFPYLESDSLGILEKRVIRRIDSAIHPTQLASLTWEEVGFIDEICAPPQPSDIRSRMIVPSRGEEGYMEGLVSDDWRDGMDALRGLLESNDSTGIHIVVEEETTSRGIKVAEILGDSTRVRLERRSGSRANERVGSSLLPPFEQWFCMSDSLVEFRVYSLTESPYEGDWKLVVIDSDREVVWEKSGSGRVPRTIGWDWRDMSGIVIPADHYSYFLEWTDQYGRTLKSKRYQFFVRKHVFTTEVTIEKRPVNMDLEEQEIQIRLSPAMGRAQSPLRGGN